MNLNASDSANRAVTAASHAIVAAIIVATLYFARQVLVPIVLASLLSFVLTPPVLRLQKLGLGRIPSVAAITVLSFALLAGFGVLVTGQIAQLADNLPRYQLGLEDKIKAVREKATDAPLVHTVARLLEGLHEPLQRGLPAADAGPSPAPESAASQPPPVVVMRSQVTTPYDIAAAVLNPLVEPVATAGIVIVFVVFILLQREDVRDRLVWLAGARDLRRASIALDEAGARLSHYLLAQTALNATFGLLVGVGLWLIGIPSFVLWGAFAALLRFLPYIGGPLSAICPLILAAVVGTGWWPLFWTAALYSVLELVTGQVVEPLLFGRTAGMSPLAVLAAATFWSWLWGPIGLIMSMPLTLLLVVLGKHVERFSFLAVLFGDAPPLTTVESFYHKVVSGHDHEAAEQAYSLVQEQTLSGYYDEVVLPGLRLLQSDLNGGSLPADSVTRVVASIDKVVEAAGDYGDDNEDGADVGDEGAPGGAIPRSAERSREDWRTDARILCLSGRSPFDQPTAVMFKTLLAKQHIGMRLAPIEMTSSGRVPDFETRDVALVCLSYLTVDSVPGHVRLMIRRLRRTIPRARILACFWTYEEDAEGDFTRLTSELGVDLIATSLARAVNVCLAEATGVSVAAPSEATELAARRSN